MIDYPTLKARTTSRELLDVFKGYNRNLRIKEGEFRNMENLSADAYPVLSVRGKRGIVDKRGEINALAYVQGVGLFYTALGSLFTPDGIVKEIPGLYQPGEQHKQQLIAMGAHLVLAPEMKWINAYAKIDGYEHGDSNASCVCEDETVTFQLCREDGRVYSGAVPSDTQPVNPEDGDLWLDTSGKPHSLKQYSGAMEQWVSITSTYIRISADDLDIDPFAQYDGVTISGIKSEKLQDLNASTVIWAMGQGEGHTNYIVVSGIIDETVTQDCAAEGAISIERRAPQMDFVVEAGNRLWGCRYGTDHAGEFVNEIYASKLGDFKNWSCFMGIATDSWVGSVGSQGPFTGAANIGGYPVFYKENCKHKVWISDSGAHQISTTPCQGVKLGCDRSVAAVGGAVIYKSARGFCVDDGGMPEEIKDTIDAAKYSKAVGCVHDGKYYVSVMDTRNNWHLFVYDFAKKLWHREDGFHALAICSDGDSTVYAVNADTDQIVDLLGKQGAAESDKIHWMAETGEMGLESPDRKYISRLDLRLSMEVGAELTVYVQYDTEPEWMVLGSIRGTSLQTFSLPLRLRRCDHFRLRFEGEGDIKLYSITKTIVKGSDRR